MLILALAGCATQASQPLSALRCSGRLANRSVPLGTGADPSIVVHGGVYYDVQSSPDARSISVRKSRSLSTLAAETARTIWRGGVAGTPCCDLWAPELKYIRGKWYVYFAADDGDNATHRLYAIEADQPDGPYSFKARVDTPGHHWAIDGTAFETVTGDLYFLWSGWPGERDGEQSIYIARMQNPWTVMAPATVISAPELPWETFGAPPRVNEGPAVLLEHDRVFVTYSASGCWTPDYAVGLLTASLDSDLLDAGSWRKSARPILRRNDPEHIFGTGHNGFFRSPDGTEVWIVYHAVDAAQGSCGRERTIRAQPLRWSREGLPEVGDALAPSDRGRLPAGDPEQHCAVLHRHSGADAE